MLYFFYPPHCRICQVKTPRGVHFCISCQKQLTFLHPMQRCSHCFYPIKNICLSCLSDAEKQDFKVAACWKEKEEIKGLLNLARQGQMPRLFADALLVQHNRLNWQKPDLIIPLPGQADKEYLRLFAKSLRCPYCPLLYKRAGSLAQHALPWEERSRMPEGIIALKKSQLQGLHILLVDDSIATFETLKAAVRVLKPQGVRLVEALALMLIDPTKQV